jgi:hypothetical protein
MFYLEPRRQSWSYVCCRLWLCLCTVEWRPCFHQPPQEVETAGRSCHLFGVPLPTPFPPVPTPSWSQAGHGFPVRNHIQDSLSCSYFQLSFSLDLWHPHLVWVALGSLQCMVFRLRTQLADTPKPFSPNAVVSAMGCGSPFWKETLNLESCPQPLQEASCPEPRKWGRGGWRNYWGQTSVANAGKCQPSIGQLICGK